MIVVAAQYSPRPAGTKSTNHENMMGMNHCIIWFICFVCGDAAEAERELEMRCWSHMDANTMATRGRLALPVAAMSMTRKLVLRGTASCTMSKS